MSHIIIGNPHNLGITPQQICDFYAANWLRKIALSDPLFYQWQFIQNPSNIGIDECCIAIESDEILGVMGLNSRTFMLNGEAKLGAELTTWVVSEKSRNKGIGPKMIQYLKDHFEVLTGMGISQAALPIYLRNGFRYIKAIPRYIHVLDWNHLEPFMQTLPLAQKFANEQLQLSEYTINEQPTAAQINHIADTFFQHNNGFSRNAQDLAWRYDQHPYFQYHYFIVNQDCVVAIRIDTDIDGFTMAHCIDLFGNPTSYPAAISAAIALAKQHQAAAIDFFCTHTKLQAYLSAMGLFSTLDYDFFKFPHLFHPIEIREPSTTSLILWSKEKIEDLLDIGRLHISKQDADFDRPTLVGI